MLNAIGGSGALVHIARPMTAAAPESGSLSDIRKWLGFAGLCIAMFMAVLDIQIVITSLGVIERR